MGRFAELGTYKNEILYKLISNDKIVKALGNGTTDFLDQPSIPNPTSLIYNNIYPYAYVPQAESDVKTYITILFNNYKLANRAFKAGTIGLYVFSHFSLMRTDYSVLRTDYIINQIDEVFNETYDLGIGKLKFSRMGDIKMSNYHFGTYIEYQDLSFN